MTLLKSADQPDHANTKVVQLRPPSRWHDPLKLIQTEAPAESGRIVLWTISALVTVLIIWAAFGKLDIIVAAEGKLTPQTLVKIVQPAEAGVVRHLLVKEGDAVKAGQVLARLDTTVASAEKSSISSELATQQMQARRIEAELADVPMRTKNGDDQRLFDQVQSQLIARRRNYADSVAQERAQLSKATHERHSAVQTLQKLQQTLPTYQAAAESYRDLAKEGYVPARQGADKQREAIEKQKDLQAQTSAVAALDATIAAQAVRIRQLQSSYKSDLQRELAEVRAKIEQLKPSLDKSVYREGLMELRAPQDGVVKDLATTSVGAVVQPGTVVLTLVPRGEQLYADVSIKNDDIGFVQPGQHVQVKLAAYPFQKYGMLTAKVVYVSADASESKPGVAHNAVSYDGDAGAQVSIYKARVQLDQQVLKGPHGQLLEIAPGMQVVAEIKQGKRTVLEYLLSPVQKTMREAGREK